MENGQLFAEVEELTMRVDTLQAETSSLRASLGSYKSARGEASKKLHVLTERLRRVPGRIDTAVTKATTKAREELSNIFSFTLKEKGVVPDATRDMINDLVALDGVRPNKVVGVLKCIARKLGIEVRGDVKPRTVGRIVREGGAAAQLQFVEAVGTSKGLNIYYSPFILFILNLRIIWKVLPLVAMGRHTKTSTSSPIEPPS